MARSPSFFSAGISNEPMARAKKLAEKMAGLLEGESVSDVAVALTLLTSGAIHHHADDIDEARELIETVHYLEKRFLATAYGPSVLIGKSVTFLPTFRPGGGNGQGTSCRDRTR
jgi:hypothetical protein